MFSAYELYSDPESDLPSTVARVGSSGTDKNSSMAQRFKETFSYEDVKVHFVGAWYVMASRGAFMLMTSISGIPFRLLGLRVERAFSLGQSRDEACLLFPPCTCS
jgi:hypothetical protein